MWTVVLAFDLNLLLITYDSYVSYPRRSGLVEKVIIQDPILPESGPHYTPLLKQTLVTL
jgi:hypothetical protein